MDCLFYYNFGLFSTKQYKIRSMLQEKVQFSVFSDKNAYLVTEQSDLVYIEIDNPSIKFLSSSVRQVSCNNSVMCFVTVEGLLYSVGDDSEKFGLLGIRNCFSAKTPVLVTLEMHLMYVSVGHSHVAGLGENGELFTWGSGAHGELGNCLFGERQVPTQVQSSKIYMIRQVVCGKNFTAFRTAGGFLYIHGQLPSSPCGIKKVKSPYTIPGLRSIFTSYLTACESFLVVYSENKEVFTIDSCLECNKLPKKYSKVACSADSLIAISKKDKLIHELKPWARSHCKAGNLNCKIFILEELFTDKISLFSGFSVSFQLKSEKIKESELNLHYLMQSRFRLEFHPECPVVKPILRNLSIVLTNKFEENLRTAFAFLKFFVKCKNLREKGTLSLVLLSILNNFMMRCLIYKKNAWGKMRGFWEISNKRRKSKEFKRIFILQKVFSGKISKILAAIVAGIENCESFKVRKVRITEKIFSKLSLNTSTCLKKSFTMLLKHSQQYKKAEHYLKTLFNLIEKSQKLYFFMNLVNTSVIRAKMSNIINQILGFSAAKNSRLQILKHFHSWKRQIVSSKIAAISQKYARSIKTKKITEKLKQLTRNPLKTGFLCLKALTRSPINSLKLTFFLKIFNIFFNFPKKLGFKLIESHSKANKTVQNLCKKLIKARLQNMVQSFSAYLKKRQNFELMKIFSLYQTKLHNLNLKNLYKAFCRLKKTERKSLSPNSTSFNSVESPFNVAKADLLHNKSLEFAKSIDLSKLKPSGPNNLQLFLQRIKNKGDKNKKSGKKITPHTPGVQRRVKKMMTLSDRQMKEALNRSFNTTNLNDKTKKMECLSPQPKLSPWETQLIALAQSLLFSIYKSHCSQYLKRIISNN